MIEIEAEALSAPAAYKLLVGIVVPRPIAWVSTVDESGRVNLAPFSCYTFVSNDPPMVAVSVGRRDGTPKDTARNARQCGEFVVNVVDEALVSPMHLSSAEHPPGQSEADHLGIALAPSGTVRPPRVATAPVAMECRLEQIFEFGNLRSQLLVGRIARFCIAEHLYRDGKVDTLALKPLARLGGPNYARLGEILTMPVVGEAGPTERLT
jgi:flavin reductase (DIM6/NTAB) family NADH-FMN oxidoreductase RutF